MELIYDLQMSSLAIIVIVGLVFYFDMGRYISERMNAIIAFLTIASMATGFLSTMYFIWMT